MLLVHCLSVLSVAFEYCGQMVGWIKVKLGIHASALATLLDGDPTPLPKGAQPPNFRPISVVAKYLDGLRCHLVWR